MKLNGDMGVIGMMADESKRGNDIVRNIK